MAAPVDPAESGGAGVEAIRIGALTLSGSAWLESVVVSEQGDPAAEDPFRVRRARVGLAGSLVPRIGWNISGEFSSTPSLRNAFLVFRLHEQFNVRAGQATPPSGIERGTSPLRLELIDRSRLSTQLTSALDPSVTVMNEKPFRHWLSYAVTIASGAGFNQADNNRAKDLLARIEVTPVPVPGLSIVASGGAGEQPNGRRTRSGLGVMYDVRSLKIAAEGLRRTIEGRPAAEGVYVIGVYRIRPRRVTPHFRMAEIAARYVVMDDPGAAHGIPGQADEDGGAGPAAIVPATTRDMQVGGSYYVNRNVRLMLNALVPLDARTGTTMLTRLQVVF